MHILCRQVDKMVEFITGQAGSGKTTYMFSKIKKDTDKNSELCILVPEQYSYEFDKTLYFYLGAEKFNKLYSLSFTGLARQLFQLYGDPDRNGEYADELARMIMIYQAIDTVKKRPDGFRYFDRQSGYNGFAEEVMKLISDMKRSGISYDELVNKTQLIDDRLGDKTHDIAAVFFEYERAMSEYGFKDSFDNIAEAAKVANLHSYFKGKEVYIDEFESFTGDQLELMKVIIASAGNVTITLRTDDVYSGEFTLFETVNNTFRRIRDICREEGKEFKVNALKESYRFKHPDLAYLSSHIMRSEKLTGDAPESEHITVFEAKDMYSEVEYVCATIKRIVSTEADVKYRDIAVISNEISGYASVLKAAFGRYDIPYFLSIERPVTHTAIMVFFTSVLTLLSSSKLHSEHIFRILKSGILDYQLTDVSLLENYCYKWGIDDELWSSPFTPEDVDLEKLEELRSSFIEPLIKLKKKLSKLKTASNMCEELYEYLVDCGAEKNTGRLMGKLVKENRDFEASELKRLWGCLIDILDSIHETLGESEIRFSELALMIRSMIGKITYSVPPQTLDSVIAASARTARLNSPKIVFVIGATDGDFPNQVNIHGLFSETDKMRLAKQGIEISRPLSDLIASERLVVYKSLSAASERLYITYPLSDLSGQAKYPCQPVDQILTLFKGQKLRITESEIPPHYYAVTLHSAFYHYMQNRDSKSESVASIKKVLLSDTEYSRRTAYVLSRSGYTQEYRIDSSIMQKLKNFEPLRLSSTNLEEYNLCHFKYFCNQCLKLKSCEKVELDARVSGELIHECFSSILAARSKNEFVTMSFDQLKAEINNCADNYRSNKLAGEFGKNGLFELKYKKLTERLTDVFMHTQHALMNSSFTPVKYELDLRKEHSVVLPFAGNKKLSFGGIVDRVDTCEIDGEKYVRIVDYKSSHKSINATSLAGGINIQMLLYLFASTDKGGSYDDHKPAGVLYSPIQLSDVKADDHRIEDRNEKVIRSELKTSGLLLGDYKILDAMEKGIAGEYIPAKLTKSGELDSRSGCISESSMKRLREYTYRKLTNMAEELYSGHAEAVPLIIGKSAPCDYCDYANICDNSELMLYRAPDEAALAEAEDILSHKTDKETEV